MALAAALCALLAGAAGASADTSVVVGQWRFDESAGQTAIDDGPFALDGRLGLTDGVDGRDPQRIAGVAGGALAFDAHAFVRLPHAAALEPGTLALEAVVRGPGSPGRFRYVVSHGAEGCIAGSYGLYTGADGGLAFYVFDGSFFRVTAAVAPADVWNSAWHHAAGVFDGRTMRFYLDGHPVGAPIVAPPTIAYALTSSDTYFGTYQGTCSLPLRGDIDLVRLWRGALAPDTVGTLADAALSGADPGPIDTPDPGSVPTTDVPGSNGEAPASRTTIAPIAEGQALPVTVKPQGAGDAGSGTSGAPARACGVSTTTKRLVVGRRTHLTVKVALRGKPLKAVQVVAVEARSMKRLAVARTAKDGRARLRVTPRRRGNVTVKVTGRTDCGATVLPVLRAPKK